MHMLRVRAVILAVTLSGITVPGAALLCFERAWRAIPSSPTGT